jgi:hypothetical protein
MDGKSDDANHISTFVKDDMRDDDSTPDALVAD